MFLTALALGVIKSGPVDAKVVDAALFKNGYAVITTEVTLPASGELSVNAPTGAVLGTFWIRASEGKLTDVWTTYEDVKTERGARSVEEFLNGSIGKTISFTYGQPPTGISGVLLSVNPEVVVLKVAGGGIQLIPRGYLQIVNLGGEDKSYHVSDVEHIPVIKLRGLAGTHVSFNMVRQGLSWAPAYNVDITDKDKLKLTARAIIVNDFADLSDQDIRLVTGFPNLPFLGQLDPIQPNIVLNAVVRDSNMQSGGGFGGGGQMQAQFANRAAAAPMTESFAGISQDAVQGFAAEDLFMYPQKHVNLKVGERLYRQIFDGSSKYEHVYTLEAESLADQNGGRPNMDATQLDVWHEIKFQNTTGIPLTTGPAEVVKGADVLGQDTLTYSSVNDEVHVKITKALDINSRQVEEEKGRERAFIKDQYNNPRYDRISVSGHIDVFNRKKEAVTLEVTKNVYGEISDVNLAGTWVKTPSAMWEINPLSIIKWRVTLEPGKQTSLTYNYKVLRNPT